MGITPVIVVCGLVLKLRPWECFHFRIQFNYEQYFSPTAKDIHDIALAPDGNVMATAGGDGIVKFWNIAFESTDPIPK